MNVKPLWTAVFACASIAAHAADPAPAKEPAKGPAQTQAEAKPKAAAAAKPASAASAGGGGPLTKKFCCTSPSGKACYVFGSASCGNCDAFCKGEIVIQ